MQAVASRLEGSDLLTLSEALNADPVQNVYLLSELRLAGVAAAEWWGVTAGGRVRGAMLGGPLVVPWIPDPSDARAFGGLLHDRQPRMIVGPRDHVVALHHGRGVAPEPRQVRDPQPLMVVDRSTLVAHPPARVRRGTLRDLDVITVAAAAMHREEMGVDPLTVDPVAWRNRMSSLINRGWSWVWVEDGQIIFKAELSAWTPDVVQIQGVYTNPFWRGQGVAAAGMTMICSELLATVPMCSLYVNSYNTAALRLYARLGFRRCADFATYLY